MAKESAENKAKRIEEERRAEGFLPQYSDYYFESKSESGVSVSIFVLMLSGFFGGLASEFDFENGFLNFLFFICIAQFVVFVLLAIFCDDLKKVKGYYLEPDGIRTDLYFRPFGTISYETVNEAVKNGRIYYRTEGLVIGTGADKLTFHYEIGDSKAQKHIQDTYALLQTHIYEKLPPFDARIFDLLDRRYFYKKSLRKRMLVLVIALFVFVGLLAAMPIRFSGSSSIIITSVIETVGVIGFELVCLFEIYRFAKLYAKNLEALREKCIEYQNIRFGRKYSGYVLVLAALFLVILVNLFVILYL